MNPPSSPASASPAAPRIAAAVSPAAMAVGDAAPRGVYAPGDASPDAPLGEMEPGESVHFPPTRWPARALRDRRMGFGMPSSCITPPSSPCSRPRGVTFRWSGSFAPALRLRLAARRAFSASTSPRTNSKRSRSSRNRVNSCASCCWFPANEGTNVHTARRSWYGCVREARRRCRR